MAAKKNGKRRTVIIGNAGYGLYYGDIEATDAEIVATKAARVYGCRHIAYWKGEVGGITSLASKGPHSGSRIGLPADGLVTGIVNIYDVSPEAVAAFAAVAAKP